MNDDEILALYDWASGDCFRCAKTDIDTTLIDEVHPRIGGTAEFRACRVCVLAIEDERKRVAARQRQEYQPGRLGSRSRHRVAARTPHCRKDPDEDPPPGE